MNAEDSLKLARRFIELPKEKRRLFLEALQQEGVDFSVFPIAPDMATSDRDGLSYAQRRMAFLWQLDPQGAAYNLPMAVRLKGQLNAAALQEAFDQLAARHESLRTRLATRGDEWVQEVLAPSTVMLGLSDLGELDADRREEQVIALARAEAQAPFDLLKGPLWRVKLLRLADDEHVVLLTLHHIIADGWSLNVLIDEFSRCYVATCRQQPAVLLPLPVQYRDYALWQRTWLEAGEQERQLAYWQARLGDDHSPLALPFDYPRPLVPSHRGARHEFAVGDGLAERLRGVARQHGVTLFMVFLAAFKVLLQRQSGQTAIRVGVPVANRHRSEVEGLIGCFINTQVLHTDIDPFMAVTELFGRVKETALGAQGHQDLPFERLVEALGGERGSPHHPLFQVLFNHQATIADAGQVCLGDSLVLEKVVAREHSARFDLALDTYESAGRLHAVLTYATDLFAAQTIEALAEQWLLLLDGLTGASTVRVGELARMAREPEPSVRTRILAPEASCIHHLIDAAADQAPQRLAVVSGGSDMTYAALQRRSDALAQRLVDAGVTPDQRVGVMADRSVEMVAAILAVLKAGAAYLPLEPDQPLERQAFMLTDSAVGCVLGPWTVRQRLPAQVGLIDWSQETGTERFTPVSVSPANLAYVIYTSGTTGAPKGVGVSHGALVNYVNGVSQRLPLERMDNLAMVTTPAADLGHTLFYGALCKGKTLHLLHKEQVLDADAFAAYLHTHVIDGVKTVPSHLQAMLGAGAAALPRCCLVLGGETCSPALKARIAALAPDLAVINHYGPTETTVGVFTHPLADQPLLGFALDNSVAYVLDATLHATPGAARGELYIGGAGLARGYLGRAALTAERFVPDPFQGDGARMYRTGDWVRSLADGAVVFAGRIDGQVKVRGYRVELGEVEAALRQLPGLDGVAVTRVGDEGNHHLAAYVVAHQPTAEAGAQRALIDGLRATLAKTLPEHMVPHYFMVLPSLPVTANGKVDKRALPTPVATLAAYRPATTALQQQVAEIWAHVLQVEQVGLDDNFFALGGHSLLATQVVSRIRHQLKRDVALRVMFDTADLDGFVAALAAMGESSHTGIERLDRSEPLPLSHAQYRQWMFWKLNPDSTAYNTPLAVRLTGPLQAAALQGAFDALVVRHEALRTVFVEREGQAWQRIEALSGVRIAVEDLSREPASRLHERLDTLFTIPFDLAVGPLLRVNLIKTADDEHLLAVCLHHIVSDGWSMSVMVRELAATYNGLASGKPLALQPLPVQYADYASWQRERLASTEQTVQLAYWKAQLEDDFSVLELPADRRRPSVQSYRGGRIDVPLPSELTAGLRRLADAAGATLFHIFLASFALLLSRYSGRERLNVGIPVTNRNRLEFEGMIGFFVNTVIARVAVDPSHTFRQLLAGVKETALQAQANKDLPFDALVEALKPERGLGYNPLFQVMYNHLLDVGARVSGDSVHGLQVREVQWSERTTQFDLSLDTLERSDGVLASFNYASDLFDRARIERLAQQWLVLLGALVRQEAVAVAELPLLDRYAHAQLTEAWNPAADHALNRLDFPSLFERQALLSPLAVAVRLDEQAMSYGELNLRANRLASHLIAQGVGPDVRVGIAMERGLDLVVGLIAILKAGGAYVPLDPAYPQDRLAFMTEDSGIRLLLTQPHLAQRFAAMGTLEVIELCVEHPWFNTGSDLNPAVTTIATNLAYVIYTSGSTGRPKGVAIAHEQLSCFCKVAADYSRLSPHDKVLQFATVSFDGFVEQLYPALCVGAQVVMRGEALWDIETLHSTIVAQGITVADLPTAYWRQFASHVPAAGNCGALRQVHVGGEAMPPDGLDDWLASGLKHVRLLNTYGPTEATVVSTVLDCALVAREDMPQGSVPIGQAIAGRATYLCDSGFSLAPPGVVNELLIGGRGCLARGYFNRPALTAERFVPDPFDTSGPGGGRLYRTGDLARYREDGVLEYGGRIDHQVKLRGFRVELGEIEARLQALPQVRDAVVLAQQGAGGTQLVGYVVPADAAIVPRQEDHPALRETLRIALKAHLVEHMVPAYLLFMGRLPLSPNGKLDRKALPPVDASLLQQRYIAPQTPLQRQIADTWAALLKLDRVGLNDHFFELGGHSLLATQVVSRLRQALCMEIPLRGLFENPVLQAFAEYVEQCGTQHEPVWEKVDREQPLPLSYGQQRLWLLWQLDPAGAAYHVPATLRLSGTLDVQALQRAFTALTARHELLRTTFRQDGDQPVQIIQANSPFELPVEQVVGLSEAELQTRMEAHIQRPFDLEAGPLLRATLLRAAVDEHVLVLVQHHIIADGWSVSVMVDELVSAYEAYRQGQEPQYRPLAFQYADFAQWQRRWMEAGEQERQLAYWKAQLGAEQPVLQLPTDRPRPVVASHAGARHLLVLDEALTQGLKRLAREHDATLFTVLLASFQAVLHRCSGQMDIRVGVPIANRNRLETEGLIGFFVNTQVLKAQFTRDMTFEALLEQVKRHAQGAQAHQDLPFEQLVQALQPERSMSHSPLFQVMYNHQAQGHPPLRTLAELHVQDMPRPQRTSQFDLTLDTAEEQARIHAALTYATELFDASTIESLARQWVALLESVVSQPAQRVAALALLGADEPGRIARQWNPANVHYPAGHCLHQLIEAQAARAPHAIALRFQAASMTYEVLNRQANRLAHALLEHGVGPEVRVGLAVQCGLELVVGLLAILKAGGAYVPLDPDYPQDRLAYMLEDSGIGLLLTHAELKARLPVSEGVRCLEIDQCDSRFAKYAVANPDTRVNAQNLAYVIYTSGSTGRPKGTLLSHYNAVRLFQATQGWFNFDASDVWTVFHSYAFDFSVWELFGALLHGGQAVIVPKDVARSADDFHQLLVDARVTVLNQTPSAFKQLIPVACQASPGSQALALRWVIFGGEALDVMSLAPWFERFGDAQPQLVNMYGITETTVHVTYRPVTRQDLAGATASPLGVIIPDLSWYLLDAEFNLTSPGCQGELHVGQAGLARGYHHRPALTAERFVPDPFDTSPEGGGRLYRTGDLARWRAEHSVEYSGRIDHQVKVRGFRIELGEIEARLRDHIGVHEAVVLTQDEGDGAQVVAYIVPEQSAALDDADTQRTLRERLRHALREHLPEYMVPAHWVFLARLTLTTNGKLDRKALPAVDASASQATFVAPRTAVQQQVAGLWAEVLKLDRIGLDDHFFELGGHSLLAAQVVARVRKLGYGAVKLRDLFDAPRLADFAARLASGAGLASGEPSVPLQAFPGKTSAPLALVQRRLWMVEQLNPGGAAYAMPMALRLRGELSLPCLEASLQALVCRHEVLRTTYGQDEEGEPVALITDQLQVTLPYEDISHLGRAEQQARVASQALANEHHVFNLEQAPLLRMQVVRLGPQEHVLFYSMHHIISDGWSMALLANELVDTYVRRRDGDTDPLPQLAVQYSDFALWQQALERNGVLERQAQYWRHQLQGYSGRLTLPVRAAADGMAGEEGGCVPLRVPAALAGRLGAMADQAQVTLYTLLLASFQALLHQHSGSRDLVVGIDYAGRQHAELEGLIGFFVNVLPVRSVLTPGTPFLNFLAHVRDNLLGAIDHQDLPFDMIVEAAHVVRHKGVSPLVQVLFVMNNVPVAGRSIDGLTLEPLASISEHSKFDMALFIEQTPDGGLDGQWRFASGVFGRGDIQTLVEGWVGLLEHLSSDQNLRLETMNMQVHNDAASSAPVAAGKANKLDKFLKKNQQRPAAGAQSPVRESLLVPSQDFPLLLEPTDPGLDVVEWVRRNRPLIEEKLARHGGILFRGFAVPDSQAFEAFAEAVQPGLYGSYGDLPKKEGGQNTYRSTPYPEKKMILFHNESAHQDSWPRKQLFFCELPSPVGGATPVVDCRQLHDRLPAALRERLANKGLLYVRTFTGKLDVSWQHFFKTDQRSEVEARCRSAGIEWRWLAGDELQIRTPCPAIITHPSTGARSFFNQVQLHHIYCLDADVREDLLTLFGLERMPRNVYYGDGSPIEDEVMQLIGELYEACAVRFDWRQGDVILLDNMLVAHARDPFEGPRKIVVAMGDMMHRSDMAGLAPAVATREQEVDV